jgi:putative aldouronate transport system permease protein
MQMQRNADFLAKNSHMLGAEAANVAATLPSQTLKMALVVFIVVPIACAYPFFQRYVVAGLTIGSVKG